MRWVGRAFRRLGNCRLRGVVSTCRSIRCVLLGNGDDGSGDGERTSDFAHARCRSWAASAEHVGGGQTGDGAVVFDSAHTSASLVFTADPEFLPGGVGGDGRRGGEENSGVLHAERRWDKMRNE